MGFGKNEYSTHCKTELNSIGFRPVDSNVGGYMEHFYLDPS